MSAEANVEKSAAGASGLLVVLAGPSGVGKSTLCTALVARAPRKFALSVSATTRPPRPTERDGTHYWFCSRVEFDLRRDAGELLEHNEYQGHGYGTPRAETMALLRAGRVVLLDIDVNGAARLKASDLALLLVFVAPPSFDSLAARIRRRPDGMTPEQIDSRLAQARDELAQASWFDHTVFNDDVERAANELAALIDARRAADGERDRA